MGENRRSSVWGLLCWVSDSLHVKAPKHSQFANAQGWRRRRRNGRLAFFFLNINKKSSWPCCKRELMYVQCMYMSQLDFAAAILVFCVLENVGHFVCVIIIWENMRQMWVCVHMCASYLVWSPWASALIRICFMRFLMFFKAAPGGSRLWHFNFFPPLFVSAIYFSPNITQIIHRFLHVLYNAVLSGVISRCS